MLAPGKTRPLQILRLPGSGLVLRGTALMRDVAVTG